MAMVVEAMTSAAEVLARAGEFLRRDPVNHNLILTLLDLRVVDGEDGRYWVVTDDGAPAGVVFQSPVYYPATVTPMAADVVMAAVDAIVAQRVALPGVNGEAATAARFAGHWAERTKMAARPVEGQRLYEVDVVTAPTRSASGGGRPA